RLGGYDCRLVEGTRAHAAYEMPVVRERHRHRYEMNNQFVPQLEQAGLVIAGRDLETNLVEIVEIADHPFMMGAQFHPEFTSRPNRPNALFRDFVGAACVHAEGRGTATATSSTSVA